MACYEYFWHGDLTGSLFASIDHLVEEVKGLTCVESIVRGGDGDDGNPNN